MTSFKALQGHGPGLQRHRFLHDAFRRLEILLHEHRRNIEHLSNVVEAVAGVIGGEFFIHSKINASEVPDRVAVFCPIQPAENGPAGIRLRWIEFKDTGFDPLLKRGAFLRGGLRFLVRWGHEPGPHVFEHTKPKGLVRQESCVAGVFVE